MSGIIEQDANGSKGPQWSVFKEVLGTFIGISPFVIALVMWGSSVQERIRVTEVKVEMIQQLDQKQREALSEQRREIIDKLERLVVKIEALQQTAAKSARP